MKNIKLKGAKNIRDLCNVPIKNGKIKGNKLLRGSGLYKLTDQDMNVLVEKYKLSTVIDLRTAEEMIEKPDKQIANVNYLSIPIFGGEVIGITHENNQIKRQEDAINMADLYKLMFTGEYLENFGKVIKTIMQLDANGYSVLFHCSEGKDRTGITAAMLLLILGADKKDIMRDYLYTNRVNKIRANKYYWSVRILKKDKQKAKVVKDIFLAKKQYLEAIFDTIDKNWKNTDDFIQNGLHIDDETIQNFRKKVVQQ